MTEHNEENSWPIASSILIKFSSSDIANIILQALAPETETQIGKRAHAVITRDEDDLLIRLVAKDQIALRATMNSFLRWIDGALSTLEFVRGNQSLESS
ncbi:MAG: KEOPS complex subunit Pcc1 [Candidatus Thorarchaeota archaeon]